MTGVVEFCTLEPAFRQLWRELESAAETRVIQGVGGSARSLAMAALHRGSGRPLLVVTANASLAERLRDDLTTWLGPEAVVLFPSLEVLPYEVLARSGALPWMRAQVLTAVSQGWSGVVVAAIGALLRRLGDPQYYRSLCGALHTGDAVPPQPLAEQLHRARYEAVPQVEAVGQYAWRGGILDLFPPGREFPVRAEFFGDELDSLREFDPGSQRSLQPIASCAFGPAAEDVFAQEARLRAREAIARELDATLARLSKGGHATEARRLEERVWQDLEKMKAGVDFAGLDQYLPYLCPQAFSLLDYFSRPPVVVLDQPSRLQEAGTEMEQAAREQFARLLTQGLMLPGQAHMYIDLSDLERRFQRYPRVAFSLLGDNEGMPVRLTARPVGSYHGRWDAFCGDLRKWRQAGARVLLVASTEDRARALGDRLADEGIVAPRLIPLTRVPAEAEVVVTRGDLEAGFVLPELGLTLVTDADVYGRPKRRRLPQPKEKARLDLGRLVPGDFVVHESHGIGKYLGVRTLEIEGVQRDYLFIQYAGGDALYVPTEQIDLIQKFVGAEGSEPRLNRLGGTEWARAKNRVKESVRQMAQELLRLYALRQTMPGHAFPADTPWQREFEDAFRFEETPDQRQATEEIKRDMEQPRPMDRLLCGDVGYGKTEVAIRAAFKCVLDGKQVAVLVPTTILAQQHYRTFRERLAGYPIHVEVLSRFRSPKQQEVVLKQLRQGTVDVVIGTHRLLQDDVSFHDLGLLIIDEEHRFGVEHKERLKRLRLNVDVLSLTATPIPRTLHMGLGGLRDMSIIETPPEDRFPVQTYVVEYSDHLVRDAIERELRRGGQVFYVHNRVKTIARAAARVQDLAPRARVAVAHGQMREDQLEKVMLDFLEGEYDVLVSTSIIESGLDMPNVNTLIVEDAHELGLAQLYQLRGRVGRSNRLAYAYFTFARNRTLSETAEKRLAALADFTELGSGFKIAMRDLEIRGAGNILGPEQHGFIAAVGFDLYCRLLEESVRELQGHPVAPPVAVTLELKVDAYLPDAWIADSSLKIEAYKMIGAVSGQAEAELVRAELEDRYGPAPLPAQNLLAVARVKALCQGLGITAISQVRDRVLIRLPAELRPGAYMRLGDRWRGRLSYSGGRRPTLTLRWSGGSDLDRLGDLLLLLERLGETLGAATSSTTGPGRG